MAVQTDDLEKIITDFFEANLRNIQAEGGHPLTPEVQRAALHQVLMYWRKLSHIATRVTDTEVRLSLPLQRTPSDRSFSVEGVVDIVREQDHITMYDLKTYDAELIRHDHTECERQLNVYAHIWEQLRDQSVNEMAVISTSLPDALSEALRAGDQARIKVEMARWDPVINIPVDPAHVVSTIQAFGRVVDAIEDGRFRGPDEEQLRKKMPGTNRSFALNVCRNCDGRFSCDSYRAYMVGSTSAAGRRFRAHFRGRSRAGVREEWLDGAVEMEKPGIEMGEDVDEE